jgi:hypothetical protein
MAFRSEFRERLAQLNNAIDAMPGDISANVPGMTRARLKRFFQRFDVLLGRLDRQGAKHPQYLYFSGMSLPEYINIIVDQSLSHMPSGSGTFFSNNFQQLLAVQDQLEKAVGTDIDELRKISLTTSADLASSVEQSDSYLDLLREASKSAQIERDRASEESKRIVSILKDAETMLDRIKDVRGTVEALTNPDGRNRTSLEALARRARERMSDIDADRAKVESALSQATADVASTKEAMEFVKNSVHALDLTRVEAEKVLGLSSQAGLAASYKKEADRLQKISLYFTVGLYFVSLVTLLFATLYVLPELTKAIAGGAEDDLSRALSLTFLRSLALGPLVYVIYFTSNRINVLEMLRMDYAEKAAASLSYSGYREQMTADEDLLHQLKASLLSKFHDHPERLLRGNSTSTSSTVVAQGFTAESRVESVKDSSKQE